MWISKDHYHWLINVNPNERVAAEYAKNLLLIQKLTTETYMLQEKIGELNVQLRRAERQVADKDMRDYGTKETIVATMQKLADEVCPCGCGLTLEKIRELCI